MSVVVHHYAAVLGAIAGLWLAALVAPGPDFLFVTRVSVIHGRAAARSAALGVATGIAAWAAAGFFGVHALFVAFPWLNGALKLVGGLYLVLLGVRLLAGSRRLEPPGNLGADLGTARFPFWLGLLNNLANPKAPLFVSSLFAATLPPHPQVTLGLMAVGLMFALALAWYVLVARVLTIRRVAGGFARARHWIDRAAGIAFMGFGTKLVLDRSA